MVVRFESLLAYWVLPLPREAFTQEMGMNWLVGSSSLALLVPSYIVPLENNILINPAHPDYVKIKLTIEKNPFFFDPRLCE